jgi:predicted dehydrogenase
MNRKISILILGGGSRGSTYAHYAKDHPQEMEVVGIAEPRDFHRESFVQNYGIPLKNVFRDWESALEQPKFADAVVVSTQDRMHFGPVMKALAKGYHVLVEKPMSVIESECKRMTLEAEKRGKILAVCHVLRYTPFYREMKRLVSSGVIGDVVTVEHIEPVKYWHHAHSYVRGNWRRADQSSPMILAKSCHDLDIINWLVGKRCRRLSSFGSLKHFTRDNSPRGSSSRCTDCGVEKTCPYSAVKIYMNPEWQGWPVNIITTDLSPKGRMKALQEGPYGRCVYRCDNDVVDHQVVSLEYDGGITASFTMTAFATIGDRRTRVMGTRGELIGDSRYIEHLDFLTDKKNVIDTVIGGGDAGTGHGGGDVGLMRDFCRAVAQNDPALLASSARDSLASHLMAFAAERSRKKRKVLTL